MRRDSALVAYLPADGALASFGNLFDLVPVALSYQSTQAVVVMSVS